MSNNVPDQGVSSNAAPDGPLAELVRERVLAAERAQQRRDGAVRPRIQRGRSDPRPNSPSKNDSPESSEAKALRSVFRGFGKLHRGYRQRTGDRMSPELRTAALAFKQAPSLASLIAVAGFLDDLDLLRA